MITYKYKLYRTDKTKHLDKMLREAAFVWNHALALQKRYYRIFKKYIGIGRIKAYFVKRIKRTLLGAQTTQEILERLDTSFQRFFKHIATRPPKFKKANDFSSIVYKQCGFTLNGNRITLNSIHNTFKFSYSRPYEGKVKRISIKRTPLGEYYIVIIIEAVAKHYGKSHNGASVGIDFGLKTYMTLSDGTTVKNPRYLQKSLPKLRIKARKFSKSMNKEKSRKALDRAFEEIVNKRTDWQWKLAHDLCRRYDNIFIEDLRLSDMTKHWGRKMNDLAHAEFIGRLEYVAVKYGVTVHKIDRFFPSSKTCTCGYVNKNLTLADRVWTCPCCGTAHDRDLLAANNILRQGIAELGQGSKSKATIVA